jgi:enoyl-[acyl-carrier protein] reductase I
MSMLSGRKGLVVGIANHASIATGCARAFAEAGAELAVTYLNDKARRFVEPVATELSAAKFLPLDVEAEGEMEAVFAEIARDWGRLDFLVHSIAFCPAEDLHGRVTDCSQAGFARAMDVSVHSLIRMAKLAEPLMAEGGTILTMSYYGAEKVVDHYNIMGPVKSALEGTVRYLAAELGPQGIRVHAISPGPMATRAGSGIAHFDTLIDNARDRAPERALVTLEDVGGMALYLVSDAAKRISGNIEYVDAGYHVRG